MSKHLGAYSQYHGPAGKVLTDYVEENIPALWQRVPLRIISVANTGSIYTGVIPGYTTENPLDLLQDQTLYFTPHIPCNDSPTLSLNGKPAFPLVTSDLIPFSAGELVPDETYAFRVGPGYFIHQPGLSTSIGSTTSFPNFLDLGARPGTGTAYLSRNNDALAEAAASHKVWYIPSNLTFAFSQGVFLTSDSGFFCPGWANFLMKTGAGYFDCDKNIATIDGPGYIPYTSPSRTLLQNVPEAADITLSGIEIALEANTDIRTAGAIHFYKARNMYCPRVRTRGFKENLGGIIRIRSCSGGTLHSESLNLSVNSNSLTYMQVSAVEIDNDVTDVNSTNNMQITSICENFQLGPLAREKYREQTDCLDRHWAEAATLPSNCRFLAWARGAKGPGEVFDTKGIGDYAEVFWDDCRITGIKMPYGGHHNYIRFRGAGTGLAAILVQTGTGVFANRAALNNTFEGECTDIGRHFEEDFPTGTMQAGITNSGFDSTTVKSHGNLFRCRLESFYNGTTYLMPNALLHYNAGHDVYEVQADAYGGAFAVQHMGDSNSRFASIKRTGISPVLVRARFTTATATSLNHQTPIPFTTEDVDNGNHYDPTTQSFVLPEPGFIPISGQVKVTNLLAGRAVAIAILVNSVYTTIGEFANTGTGTLSQIHVPFNTRYYSSAPNTVATIVIASNDSAPIFILGHPTLLETYINIGPIEQFYNAT